MSGPLGILAGMRFDPDRNRYFPIPKDESPRMSRDGGILLPTGCTEGRMAGKKRMKLDHQESGEVGPSRRPLRAGRMGLSMPGQHRHERLVPLF